jgi:hypothetical protein
MGPAHGESTAFAYSVVITNVPRDGIWSGLIGSFMGSKLD